MQLSAAGDCLGEASTLSRVAYLHDTLCWCNNNNNNDFKHETRRDRRGYNVAATVDLGGMCSVSRPYGITAGIRRACMMSCTRV